MTIGLSDLGALRAGGKVEGLRFHRGPFSFRGARPRERSLPTTAALSRSRRKSGWFSRARFCPAFARRRSPSSQRFSNRNPKAQAHATRPSPFTATRPRARRTRPWASTMAGARWSTRWSPTSKRCGQRDRPRTGLPHFSWSSDRGGGSVKGISILTLDVSGFAVSIQCVTRSGQRITTATRISCISTHGIAPQ